MFNSIKRLFKKKKSTPIKKGWLKIEDGYDDISTFTEYTDHNGFVYRMYDLRMSPGFNGAMIKD